MAPKKKPVQSVKPKPAKKPKLCEPFLHQPPFAIDGGGNLWVPFTYTIYFDPATSHSTSTDYYGFAKVSNSGTILSGPAGYATTQFFYPISMGIDSSGNIWGVAESTGNVEELIGVATPVVTPLSVGVKNNTLGTRP